jgi:xylose isomerase
MENHLRFAVAYWHTFQGRGADPFGSPAHKRPWHEGGNADEVARRTLEAAFEFFSKIGVNYYCTHDRDLAPEGMLEGIVKKAKKLQRETGVKLLWGTADLFSHPRYTHGALTNPDPKVVATAGLQIKRAIDMTVALGGKTYLFWGGREGYTTLLNTDMKQERELMARMLRMAVDYGREAGLKGPFFIEPKPREPSIHQYDHDAATTLGFLREFDLIDDFMLNIEGNHATLAGHSFEHELRIASNAGKLGSLDINRGDAGVGWDTDRFPTDLRCAVLAMLTILGQEGLRWGGLNFDAKVRRGSFDTLDLFHAHIGGMDTFARGLLIADRIRRDGALEKELVERYSGFRHGMGRKVAEGKTTLEEMGQWALKQGEPELRSGRQEALENLLNDYIYCTRIE